MSFMVAFGLASLMMIVGVFLRSKIKFLRNMLVPASVIAGIIGFVLINVLPLMNVEIDETIAMFTTITNELFTLSFISISLTGNENKNSAKSVINGSLGMGLVWCFLYAFTPLIGMAILALIGKPFDMHYIYGTLIPYAFCQGPGQATSYGILYEPYGWNNSAMVSIAFSAIGFLVAFIVGIPIARAGIRKGYAKNCGEIDEAILRGYYTDAEQKQTNVKDTTYNSNIESLAFHLAILFLCYFIGVGISKLFALIPGFIGKTLSGMLFVSGMIAAYLVKFVMKKLGVSYLLDNNLQTKLTAVTSDYLTTCAFMSVSIGSIGMWIIPITIISIVVTVFTTVVCLYFGRRFGGENDFERTLGLFGSSTGTIPSGISLVRIVDPELKTTTSLELGAINAIMIAHAPIVLIMTAFASGALSLLLTVIILLGLSLVFLVLLKVLKLWNKKTY